MCRRGNEVTWRSATYLRNLTKLETRWVFVYQSNIEFQNEWPRGTTKACVSPKSSVSHNFWIKFVLSDCFEPLFGLEGTQLFWGVFIYPPQCLTISRLFSLGSQIGGNGQPRTRRLFWYSGCRRQISFRDQFLKVHTKLQKGILRKKSNTRLTLVTFLCFLFLTWMFFRP